MGLKMTGPADETPIQAVRRLTALRRSLTYDGSGYYSGGPNGAGCDGDDMNDLNAELAGAATEALAGICNTLERIKVESSHLAKDCPPAPHACPACEIQLVVTEAIESLSGAVS